MMKKSDPPDVDHRGEHAAGARRKQPVEEVDVDVARAPHRGGNAHEDRAHQQVAGDLLGPRRRVVHHVAREELVEHAQAEEPEEAERQPILDNVMTEVDRSVVDVEVTFRVEDVCLLAAVGRGHRSFLRHVGKVARPGWSRPRAARSARGYLIATILS